MTALPRQDDGITFVYRVARISEEIFRESKATYNGNVGS